MAVDAIRGSSAQKRPESSLRISFPESRGFRPEIQGLCAFAVLLVVIYHVWAGKPLNLLNYWTHVFTRRLPAASVAILLILAGSLLVLSPTAWSARAVNEQASPGEQSGGGVL